MEFKSQTLGHSPPSSQKAGGREGEWEWPQEWISVIERNRKQGRSHTFPRALNLIGIHAIIILFFNLKPGCEWTTTAPHAVVSHLQVVAVRPLECDYVEATLQRSAIKQSINNVSLGPRNANSQNSELYFKNSPSCSDVLNEQAFIAQLALRAQLFDRGFQVKASGPPI